MTRPSTLVGAGESFGTVRFPSAVLVGLALVAALASMASFLLYAGANKAQQREELSIIAELKTKQIADWLRERRTDAYRESHNQLLAQAFVGLNSYRRNESARQIRSYFSELIAAHSYDALILFDPSGEPQIALGANPVVRPSDRERAAATARYGSITLSDFHKEAADSSAVELGFLAPIFLHELDEMRVVGTMLFRFSAASFLYPTLEQWPVHKATGEALLVRRDGDEIVYLSKLRYRNNAELELRIPVSSPKLTAAMAVQEGEGATEGVDYRGVPVLAAYRSLSDTPWYLVAKIDTAEAYAPAYRMAASITVLWLFLIATAGGLLAYRWRTQVAVQTEERFKSELERVKLAGQLEYLGKYASDIVFLTDDQGRFTEVNDRAVLAWGYSRAELMGMRIRDVIAPGCREQFDSALVSSDGPGMMMFETKCLSKDGLCFWVEISARILEANGERLMQGIARDVDERKQSEADLQVINRLYATLAGVNAAVGRSRDRKTLFDSVCRVVTEAGGFCAAWIGVVDPDARVVTLVASRGIEQSEYAAIESDIGPIDTSSSRTAVAIREKRVLYTNDYDTDLPPGSWQQSVHERGITSRATLPIENGNAVVAIMKFYALERAFVHPKQLSLLREIGTSISSALQAYAQEANRVQLENMRLEALRRVRAQLAVSSELSVSEALTSGSVGKFCQEVTERGAATIGVERANVWLFNESRSELRCIDLYQKTPHRHSAGAILREHEYRSEIATLSELRYVDADDPMTDPRTAGYVDSYVKPLRISSMLDAAITVSGQNIGVLCFEHVDRPHHWAQDELAFACQLADKVALCIVNHRRREAEAALAQQEARVRALVESSTDFIWEVDENAVYTYASATVQSILGLAPEEVIGRTPFDLMPDGEAERVRGIFDPIQASRRPFTNLLNTARHRSGRLVTLETNGVPIFDQHGIFRGYRGIDRDITERNLHAQQIAHNLKQAVQAIAMTIEKRDPYVAGHHRRAATLAVAMATEMGLAPDRIEGLAFAADIYDIGMISIPAEILNRPARLRDTERALIRTHVQVGHDIVASIDFDWPVADIILQHHERLDGSGYPRGLQRGEILLEASVLAVADVMEAMTSHRPYRPAHTIDSALGELIAYRDIRYDPAVVDACVRLFREKGFAFPQAAWQASAQIVTLPVSPPTRQSVAENTQQARAAEDRRFVLPNAMAEERQGVH